MNGYRYVQLLLAIALLFSTSIMPMIFASNANWNFINGNDMAKMNLLLSKSLTILFGVAIMRLTASKINISHNDVVTKLIIVVIIANMLMYYYINNTGVSDAIFSSFQATYSKQLISGLVIGCVIAYIYYY